MTARSIVANMVSFGITVDFGSLALLQRSADHLGRMQVGSEERPQDHPESGCQWPEAGQPSRGMFSKHEPQCQRMSVDPLLLLLQGQAMAQKIGAKDYMECSSRTGQGVREVFQRATRAALLVSFDRSVNQNGS